VLIESHGFQLASLRAVGIAITFFAMLGNLAIQFGREFAKRP